MSTPLRAYDPDFEGPRCCDELIPLPAWWLFRSGIEVPGLNASVRGKAWVGKKIDDELAKRLFDPPSAAEVYYCRGCSTALEDVRDAVEDLWNDTRAAIGVVLQAIAAVVVFVPGIGSAVGSVLAGAGALAAGKTLSEAALDAAAGAIPGGIIAKNAFAAGRALGEGILDGTPIDEIALNAGRALARANGGELAAAAFDAAVILAQGKAIQDAGFAALKGFAKGNTLAERAVEYAEKVTRAAVEGKAIQDLLVDELGAELVAVAGPAAAEQLAPLVDRVLFDPSLRDLGSATFALAEGVPEPLARAAQALVRDDGTIDTHAMDRMLGLSGTERVLKRNARVALAAGKGSTFIVGPSHIAEGLIADPAMLWSAQHPSATTSAIARGALTVDCSQTFTGCKPKPKPAPAIVAAAAPSSGPSTAAKVATGLGVALALGGLYLWADGRT